MNREAFERSYASSHDLPLETFSQYRMGDTYRLPGIASHWRTWQMALESIVVELPHLGEPFVVKGISGFSLHDEGRNAAIMELQMAVEAAGLKVAP